MVLGGYTKGIAAYMPMPGLLMFAIIGGARVRSVLKDPKVYLTGLSALLVVGGYYLLREQVNPGYLEAVWNNELGGRYLRTAESQQAVNYDYLYYVKRMWNHRYAPFAFLIPFLSLLGLISPNKSIRKLSLFSVCFCLTFLLILSRATTKHHWYVRCAKQSIKYMLPFDQR